MSKSFESVQKHAINLELELQQCKEKVKNNMSFKVNKLKDFCKEREQYFEIQDMKAQLQDKSIAISELKKLIEKLKGKSVDTKFEKSLVIQQPNAFKSQRPSVLEEHRRNGKLTKNKTSVTASNDSLNAKTLNVKSISAMCAKCVMIDKHDLCVPKSVAKPLKKQLSLNPSRNLETMKSTCYIHDLKGNDLLIGSRGMDLYSITSQDTTSPNLICLMAKASSSQAWLWHRRLSHLNFDTINLLLKNDILVGLPKLKFIKDHLCSSCKLRKAKQKSFHTKLTLISKRRLQHLHMDLCGPMRVTSINGKRYVLVIVDDYSRYTWNHFLRSKDETPEVLIDFLRLVQRGLQAQVRVV
nr:retrovirus-related Pol polyprotein from transposon TNT 1-94 [Tanacetum cinerariifolium]